MQADEEAVSATKNQHKALPSPDIDDSSEEYLRLQRRALFATLVLSALAVAITAIVFERHVASSIFVGGLSGALYLWLLARSVGKLGKSSQTVGKTQLLVPVVLFIAATRFAQLDLLPAILGFLLYKPAMILQVFLSE